MLVLDSRQVIFQLGELLGLVLVLERDKSLVEDDREDDEEHENRYENRGDDDRRRHADDAKAHPREQHHLAEEQENPEPGGEDPRELDEDAQSRVRRILYVRLAVGVRDRVDVRQDAGADQKRDKVNGNNERSANGKYDKEHWVDRILLYVQLNHRNLKRKYQTFTNLIIMR